MHLTSSREIDPGKVPFSHGYLHVLDLPRIHRLLRPVKAKIAAIQLAIKTAPSCGYVAVVANGNRTNPAGSSGSQDIPDSNRMPSSTKIHHQNGHARTLRARHQNHPSTLASSAYRRPMNSTLASKSTGTIPAAPSGADILIKRFQASLTDQFQDLVEKVWWRPFCDDYGLPLHLAPASVLAKGIKPSVNTLAQRCAFEVGRIIAHLPDEDSEQMERYYHIMPAYMRRFALLEHLVELSLSQIPIGQLITPLIGVCIQHRADAQALRLMTHLLTCQDGLFELDHAWAYDLAVRIESEDVWISTLAQSRPLSFFTSGSFQSFIREIHPRHRATLIQASFDIHMASSTPVPDRTKRARILNWVTFLVEDSLGAHESPIEPPNEESDPCIPACDLTIQYMAKFLNERMSDTNDQDFEQSGMADVALGLSLHSLYIEVTGPRSVEADRVLEEWIGILEVQGRQCSHRSDLDAVVKSYRTLTNLNALALMLDAVGLYSLSMRLLSRMLSDFEILDKNTRKQLGYVCYVTAASLKLHLKEVEQRRIQLAAKDGWRYDEVLEDWIEESSNTQQALQGRVMDGDCTDGDVSCEDEFDTLFQKGLWKNSKTDKVFDLDGDHYGSGLATPPRRLRGLTFSEGQLQKKDDPRVRKSPYRHIDPLQFAMSPARRSARSTRGRVKYYDTGSEAESEPEAGSESGSDSGYAHAQPPDSELCHEDDDLFSGSESAEQTGSVGEYESNAQIGYDSPGGDLWDLASEDDFSEDAVRQSSPLESSIEANDEQSEREIGLVDEVQATESTEEEEESEESQGVADECFDQEPLHSEERNFNRRKRVLHYTSESENESDEQETAVRSTLARMQSLPSPPDIEQPARGGSKRGASSESASASEWGHSGYDSSGSEYEGPTRRARQKANPKSKFQAGRTRFSKRVKATHYELSDGSTEEETEEEFDFLGCRSMGHHGEDESEEEIEEDIDDRAVEDYRQSRLRHEGNRPDKRGMGKEDSVWDYYSEDMAIAVGEPLPLTEPDDLAFWL